MRPSKNEPLSQESQSTWSPLRRRIVSVVICLHLIIVGIAMSANLSSSTIQRNLLDGLAPYVQTLNYRMELVPVELTHGNEVEGPFRLELHPAGNSPEEWREFPAFNANPFLIRRFSEIAKQLAYAAENQNEEFVIELTTSVLKNLMNQDRPWSLPYEADQIRVLRKFVPSREVYAAIQAGLMERPEPFIHYQAQIVRVSDDEIALVPILETTRAAKSIKPAPTKSTP